MCIPGHPKKLPQTDEEPNEEPLEIPQTDEEPQELPQTDEEPDEEPQELPHVSFRTNLPNVNNTTDENTLSVDLEGVSLPTVSKKRGRPKGSCTTAIGLPKGKKRKITKGPIPFMKKEIEARQRHILGWFVEQDKVVAAMRGGILSENHIEMIPENIPSACLDNERVDINIILKYFDTDGWAALTSVFRERVSIGWLCFKCYQDLSGESIGCDSCLEWYHRKCAGIRKIPTSQYWFCKSCK